MKTELTDLPVEILTIIMTELGKKYNGGADVAKSMSLGKRLLEASNNIDDQTAIQFQHVKVEDRYVLFQQTKGLLYKCAQAGNITAQYALAKIVLLTATQLLSLGIKKGNLKDLSANGPENKKGHGKYCEKTEAATFVYQLSPNPKSESLSHWKLVKIFLANVSEADLISMSRHLQNYVEYFNGSTYTDIYLFMHFYNTMCGIVRRPLDTCLVQYQGHYYVKYQTEGVNEETVDWKYAGVVYKLVQAEALYAFEDLIRLLH